MTLKVSVKWRILCGIAGAAGALTAELITPFFAELSLPVKLIVVFGAVCALVIPPAKWELAYDDEKITLYNCPDPPTCYWNDLKSYKFSAISSKLYFEKSSATKRSMINITGFEGLKELEQFLQNRQK